MINDLLLRDILSAYGIKCTSLHFEWRVLPNYPHVIKITTTDNEFYLKELVIGEKKRAWLEQVYSLLEKTEFCIHPLKKMDGKYLSVIRDENLTHSCNDFMYCYLLTERLEEIQVLPSAEWWARQLANIHRINISSILGDMSITKLKEHIDESILILPNYASVIEMMKRTMSLIETDVINLLNSLLIDSIDERIMQTTGVLVHGDPLNSNVLFSNSDCCLIDFESCGISVKEYDIQRLFVDIATNCSCESELESFVERFMSEYERSGLAINISLLDYYLRLDLLRTFCWLYESSISYNRQDCERQSLELNKFKSTLRSGYYHKLIALIHKTWPYDLNTIRINNQRDIESVARLISSIVPDFVCATLGGSRSHFLDDSVSDVEMYFYSKSGIPTLDDIDRVLASAGAIHRRSSSFLWDEKPWGPHSFFEINGLYFEIGYRVISDIRGKISKYLSGETVEPQKDCHDLGLGYLFSGLVASIQSEKVVICTDDSFFQLQLLANEFPVSLKQSLQKEYMETAGKLINGKLMVAAQRQDVFFYNVLSTRVIRCLMIMAFSISNTHFPGDKWNATLLLHTRWENANKFLFLLNAHMKMDISLDKKYELMVEAYKLVEMDILR